MINKGKKFLSELKLYTDYLKWKDDLNRYETWEEAYEEILQQHIDRYGDKIKHLIDEVRPLVFDKAVLASQRNLQFRGKYLEKNHCRLYNCSVLYAYSPDMFKKGFFMLLSGSGLGVNLKKKYVNMLPNLHRKTSDETVTFIIEDSIEGWCESIHALISTYCEHPSLNNELFGKQIRFDYSLIRPKGAYISGGYKAPGPDGLKDSLEKIEAFLQDKINGHESIAFSSIIAYNIFMYLSDAVLSGGIRRSAMNIVFDYDDADMLYAKQGNWRMTNPHYARSNNSVGLLKHSFSKELFNELVAMNNGDNDVGFVLMETEDQMFNPCFEISFDFFNQITDYNDTVIQMCNLCEINASWCVDKHDCLDKQKLYSQARVASILGTLQAGYTDFPFLGENTEAIVRGEALLGVSITGWMDNPELFENPGVLETAASIVRETNKEVSELININRAARTTCVKPSGNASVILQTPSGIHADHSLNYFRIMQINKESAVAKWMIERYPFMLEDSKWSQTQSDYVIYTPISNKEDAIFKNDLLDIDHLKMIEFVQKHWVEKGKNPECCYNPNHNHNVSNTVVIDDKEKVVDYIFDNQNNFVAVSFLTRMGDKDFTQAPFTSILSLEELIMEYDNAAIFASGLIIDGLHCFNGDLWEACSILENELKLEANRHMIILQKDWIRRAKKFAKNFFKGDMKKMIYCLKDVHLYHKWCKIEREFKKIPDFSTILPKPEYTSVDTMGAMACAGGACEI